MIAIDIPERIGALDPDLVERFRAGLEDCGLGHKRLGVAVSGGPDSLALLLLANAASPGLIAAATIDHGLRQANADEAKMVEGVCRGLNVPHSVIKVELGAGNLQSAARAARYEALGRWHDEVNVEAVLTAHHADDQAETFLMRLNRGSGLGGLAGIRRFERIPGWGGHLHRPLLDWRKSELEKIVRDAGIEPARDPSNEDDRFDRSRMRKRLAEADWLDRAAIARSAAHLADAEAIVDRLVQHEWDERVKRVGKSYVYRPSKPAYPNTIRLRVTERLIAELGGDARGNAIARLLDRLAKGEGGNLAGILVKVVGDVWRFEPEPPRKTG